MGRTSFLGFVVTLLDLFFPFFLAPCLLNFYSNSPSLLEDFLSFIRILSRIERKNKENWTSRASCKKERRFLNTRDSSACTPIYIARKDAIQNISHPLTNYLMPLIYFSHPISQEMPCVQQNWVEEMPYFRKTLRS